jgi:hypothetical protein
MCQAAGNVPSSNIRSPLSNLTFSIQNCNSLNISTVSDKQMAKLIAITTLCTDIILLCDIRLNNDTDAISKITKTFKCNSKRNYNFLYNSSTNSRGVGILIACNSPIKVLQEYKDVENNILAVLVENETGKFGLCSVYGPNYNDKNFLKILTISYQG